VLRRISGTDWDGWVETLGRDRDPVGRLALRTAHPDWIVRAFAAALDDPGLHADPVTPGPETEAALLADDARPHTHLVAWPGLVSRAELCREADGDPGEWFRGTTSAASCPPLRSRPGHGSGGRRCVRTRIAGTLIGSAMPR